MMCGRQQRPSANIVQCHRWITLDRSPENVKQENWRLLAYHPAHSETPHTGMALSMRLRTDNVDPTRLHVYSTWFEPDVSERSAYTFADYKYSSCSFEQLVPLQPSRAPQIPGDVVPM